MLQNADLGVIYLKSGRYKESENLLMKARKADRNSAYANFYLAEVYEKTGRYQEAILLYEELLFSMSDYPKLYYQLGNAKAKSGNQSEGFYYYGYYYWYEGEIGNAQYHFAKAVSLLPEDSRKRAEAESMLKKIAKFVKDK